MVYHQFSTKSIQQCLKLNLTHCKLDHKFVDIKIQFFFANKLYPPLVIKHAFPIYTTTITTAVWLLTGLTARIEIKCKLKYLHIFKTIQYTKSQQLTLTHNSSRWSLRDDRMRWWPVMHNVPSAGMTLGRYSVTPSTMGVRINSANSILLQIQKLEFKETIIDIIEVWTKCSIFCMQ